VKHVGEQEAVVLAFARAVRSARRFVESSRGVGGVYRLHHWPQLHGPVPRRTAGRATARLRVGQRLTVGFLDPVEDALFVTAGLRRLGYPASFHLGREVTPATPPAGFYAWVQCGDEVVSTSLAVGEEYAEVYRSDPERTLR
jgi:hypothetical protein